MFANASSLQPSRSPAQRLARPTGTRSDTLLRRCASAPPASIAAEGNREALDDRSFGDQARQGTGDGGAAGRTCPSKSARGTLSPYGVGAPRRAGRLHRPSGTLTAAALDATGTAI